MLAVATPGAVARELARVGCSAAGVEIMLPKGLFRLVRLEQVPATAANIIKQEMLALGGDAVVHWQTVAHGIERTDIVLLGTARQLLRLAEKLHANPFGLPGTGEALRTVLQNLHAERAPLRCGPYTLPLGVKTYIMGIINVTPDSFSGDGLCDLDAVRAQGERMVAEGADILDVGGESTRPGAPPVCLAEELTRVLPAVAALAELGVPVSVDTTKSAVARAALDAGAAMINDISGLRFDPQMAALAAEFAVPVVVMHMQGTPGDMQQAPHYDDMMSEICASLQQSTEIAEAAGIERNQVILDPGFGFGKTPAHNMELLRRLGELRGYGQPLLFAASRKSTLGAILGGLPPEERVEATVATTALAINNGADIVRVHDVQANVHAAKVADAMVRGQ